MIPSTCLKIVTKKFPIEEGEHEMLVNEGMYGLGICKYLTEKLPDAGFIVRNYIVEDWGWWLPIECESINMGLCIYSDLDVESNQDPEKYAILPSIQSRKSWSWKKFKSIDQSEAVQMAMREIAAVFMADPEVEAVTFHDDFPL